MGLLTPLSALLAVPLAGAIIIMYMLKLRRQDKVVSSVYLWRHQMQDIQANAPFKKLRKSLLLFVQLAILLIAIWAITRPFFQTVGVAGENTVLIIDTSASMKSTDVGRSRFDEAKRMALKSVDSLQEGGSMAVISASARTRTVSSFTPDKKALSDAISSLQPTDSRSSLREALKLALSLSAEKPNPNITVLSDGGFDSIGEIDTKNAEVRFIKIGKNSDNVGIIAFDTRTSDTGEQQIFLSIHNFSDKQQEFNIEISLDGLLVDVIEESLRAGETKQEVLSGLRQNNARVTAKLDLKDDLVSDNTASVYLKQPRRIKVLLVTKGNLFLENALNLDPRTEVSVADEIPSDISEYDISVFDRITPPDNLPPGGYLLIDAYCSDAPASSTDSLSTPSIADWSRSHPAAAFVNFSSVRLEKARKLEVKNWGSRLVEYEGSTIAAAGENERKRFIMLGWELKRSDFPLRVGFPIFITNCIDWLSGSEGEIADTSVLSDQPVTICANGSKTIEVTDPEGRTAVLGVENDFAVYDGIQRVGIYKVKRENTVDEFAANLLSAVESDTTPLENLTIGNSEVVESGGIPIKNEYWRIILILALVLLTFEWYAYHRRLG